MAVIILAGGLSTRMQRDKASLVLGDSTILRSLIARFSVEFGPPIVVERPGQRLEVDGASIVHDVVANSGPLGGIHAGLLASQDEENVVIACDMPFANPAIAHYLISLLNGRDAVVPMLCRGPEPLFAAYRKSVIPQAARNLDAQTLKLRSLLDAIDTLYVPEDDLGKFDPALRCFLNINTPKDYDEITRLP